MISALLGCFFDERDGAGGGGDCAFLVLKMSMSSKGTVNKLPKR